MTSKKTNRPALIRGRILFQLVLAAPLFLQFISAAHASPEQGNAMYQDGPSSADYREVSGLSRFARLPYRNRWSGINVDDVLQQMAEFKTAPASPALRDVWRDVALSDFEGLEIDNAKQQTDLMSERIRILNGLGYFDEAVRLYQQAAQEKPIPAELALQGVDSLALSGSADGVCLEVSMAAKTLDSDEWQQNEALCDVYFGEQKKADAIYKNVSDKAGDGFRTVYKLLTSHSTSVIQPNIPPLWRTLLLAQGATVSSDSLKNATAETLSSLAVNKKVPLDLRLSAASRAATAGTIGADRLRSLYESKYPESKNVDGLVAIATAGGDQPSVDYYTAARFTFQFNQRGTIVKNGMHKASPITSVKNQVYNWIIDKLTLHVDGLGWFAPEGFSLMTLVNRVQSANMYYDSGHLENTRFAIVHALVQGDPWPEEMRKKWEAGMHEYYKDNADTKINDDLALASAYDLEQKLQLLDAPAKEQDLRISRDSVLYESTKYGGKGLTLITALNLLGQEKKLSAVQTTEFVDIIDVLTKQGLFGERKKITLEFLIQSML
jgi:hypothetical protein